MLTLFLDLDNTTIYSKRRISDTVNMVKVEDYNGSPLSYMTKSSYEKLSKLLQREDVQIVPITTRVDYQFDRIELPDFKYAILGNGSILRVNGKVDENWLKDSVKYRDFCMPELTKAFMLLKQKYPSTDVLRFPDKMFVFGKFENTVEVSSYLHNSLDSARVNIFTQGKKIYILPKEFDKGQSIKRFRGSFETGKIISAGDEILDFSMADFSDVFITSNEKCNKPNKILSKSKIFADEIFDYAIKELG